MQMVPVVAAEAAHLTVFRRTPNYSIPASNALLSDAEDSAVKATYHERREAARNSPSGLGIVAGKRSALSVTAQERRAVYEDARTRMGFGFVLAYYDLILDQAAKDTAADLIREKIAALVDDPDTRERLMPRGFQFGPSVPRSTAATSRRSTVTTSRWSTCAPTRSML